MAGHGEWGNDASDINSLNSLLGSKKNNKQNIENGEKRRFIDRFYPFIHSARIERLYTMEMTSKEQLPANVVTAEERAEYIETGVRFGLKESLLTLLVFSIGLIAQIWSILKTTSDNVMLLQNFTYFAMLIPVAYGIAYTAHLGKYNVGVLTSKVITALFAGRMMISAIMVSIIAWSLLSMESYFNAHIDVIASVSNIIVPDTTSVMYPMLSNIATMIGTTLGGAFVVTKQSFALMLTIIIPSLFSTWKFIAFTEIIFLTVPIVYSNIHRKLNETKIAQPQEDLENY